MCSLKNFFTAVLLTLVATIFNIAEAAIVTDKMPLQCYVDHKVTSYNKDNGREVGWIDAEVDLVQITGIGGNGVAIGTHPSGSRRVKRIFWARDVFANTNYNNRNVHVNSYQQVYRTKNSSATIGSINNEDVTVVADNGNRAQIIYRLNNGTGYKMGWVPSSIVNIGGNSGDNSTNIKGDANNDGKVDENDINLIKAYIVGNVGDSAINKNNADVNGDGQINIFDMSAALSISKNNQNNNVSSGSTISWQWPVDNLMVSQSFGHYSKTMATNKGRPYHSGMDLVNNTSRNGCNPPIYAAANGTIKYKGFTNGNGYHVIIEHNLNNQIIYTLYSHLANYNNCPEVGSSVSKGQQIGIMGNTGNSFGTHLHFGILKGYSSDPLGYTQSHGDNYVTVNGIIYYNPEYVLNNGRLP